MRDFLKLFFTCTVTAMLLLAGEACRKQDTKQAAAPDYRDTLAGRYYCENRDLYSSLVMHYDSTSGQTSYSPKDTNTLLGYDTVTVAKDPLDSNSVVIAGIHFQVGSHSPTYTSMTGSSNGYSLSANIHGDTLYAEYSISYIGVPTKDVRFYSGVKIH